MTIRPSLCGGAKKLAPDRSGCTETAAGAAECRALSGWYGASTRAVVIPHSAAADRDMHHEHSKPRTYIARGTHSPHRSPECGDEAMRQCRSNPCWKHMGKTCTKRRRRSDGKCDQCVANGIHNCWRPRHEVVGTLEKRLCEASNSRCVREYQQHDSTGRAPPAPQPRLRGRRQRSLPSTPGHSAAGGCVRGSMCEAWGGTGQGRICR